jgi:aryl-alcohol dehydrogenase-like predicted oxidoreductase
LRLFDTAELYGRGQSERLLGRFQRETGADIVVATKFFPYPWRLRQGDLARALRGSLERLGAERAALYQIHWPFPPRSVETWAAALAEVYHAGLVEAVGVSNYSASQLRRAHAALAARGVPLASNQVRYNLLQRRIERNGVLEACRALGVRVIAHTPLAVGLLGGRFSRAAPPSGPRRGIYYRLGPARVERQVATLREIGAGHGRTPAQVALNWLVCQGAIPIPGARRPEHAEQAAGALAWRLSPDELAALDLP